MNKNKTHILLVLIFIGIITLPQIIFWFVKEKDAEIEISESENRKLNTKPELKLSSILEYPQKYDNYYNDHLPFRDKLREFWTNINYNLFHTTVDDRVVIGKEDWLFYRGDDSIRQVQGLKEFTLSDKKNVLLGLQKNVDRLEIEGIQTYVLIAPNKENIYREYLPDTIPIKKNVTRTEELIEYIKEKSDITVVYPKIELIDAKEDYQVYRKYDTHWNKVGAFIATIALKKQIDPDFSYDFNNIKIEKIDEKDSRDLANLASLNNNIAEAKLIVKNFFPEIKYVINEEERYEEYISNSPERKTVLFIGDSFREDMKEYFSKLYNRVIYMHRDKCSKDILENIKPDIVVIEAVERYSALIGKNLFE
ncbi:MAG: hypothetical protein HFJ53_06005 [Clostridia bacterium]|jgi:alginate O-acetyltransferase complex protein AlgJ|nr:hypothetical protein [Clostridia bacterium]